MIILCTDRFTATFSVFFLLVALSACGTTRTFSINSIPQGALVTSESKTGVSYVRMHGETPVTADLWFNSEGGRYLLTAEKRGHEPSTLEVSQGSNQTVTFELKKIDGISEAVFKKGDLSGASYTLLPVEVNVIVHSGAGAMDQKTHSPELSRKVTGELNTELARVTSGSGTSLRGGLLPDMRGDAWSALTPELNEYLSSLSAQKLAYYSLPPYINTKVPGFDAFVEKYKEPSTADSRRYFLYIRCTCVTETAGRKAGNVALLLMGAALQGYGAAQSPPRSYAHLMNSSSLQPDSGTIATFHVIDMQTSEVLYLDHVTGPDITTSDNLTSLAGELSSFPHVVLKKNE